jgi:hypothetical protein
MESGLEKIPKTSLPKRRLSIVSKSKEEIREGGNVCENEVQREEG